MPAEQLLDVLSRINEQTDQPYLDTCTLVVGDGTVRVDLSHGRGKVPASVAHLIRHPHVEVIGAPEPPPEDEQPDATTEADGGPDDAPRERRQATPEDIEAAKEYLAQEGLEVPDVETGEGVPEVREGFEALTADGQSRCQAAKADGGQCANPAAEGRACRLTKHQQQLA